MTYEEFVQLVEKNKVLPFSDFIPDHPSLTSAASDNSWHTGLETDPWLWRIRIVQDRISAYGKFFGTKASFIHISIFPMIKTILTSNRTVEERYADGLISRQAFHIYKILSEQGNTDSRKLRKIAGFDAKESKKEYEKALIELQNSCDIVITGTEASDNDSGWSSMCYELSEDWLSKIQNNESLLSIEEAKYELKVQLTMTCSDKALKYFDKKLHLERI